MCCEYVIQGSPYFMSPLFAFVTIFTLPVMSQPDAHKNNVIFSWILNFLNFIFFWNLYFVFSILTIKIYILLCFTVLFSEFVVESRHLGFISREYEISCVDQLYYLLTFRRLMTYIYVVPHRWPPDVAFYIFIQQIYVLNILNMLHTLRFFLFKMPFIS